MPRSPYVYDKVFRYVFGEPEALPLLKSLINAFFKAVNRPPVDSLELLPRDISENLYEKSPILDVIARDATGQTINVEIQTSRKQAFFERSLYYWARLFSRQAKEGDDYRTIAPVVAINLLDYEYDRSDTWLHNYELSFTRHLGIIHVELPKVLRIHGGQSEGLKEAELWSKFIESAPEALEETVPELAPEFEKARLRMEEYMALTPEALWEIQRDIAKMDEALIKNLAREAGLEEGRKEGRKEGRQEGRQEGLQEGLQEGRSEGREEGAKESKAAIASRLKKTGMDIKQIAEVTELSLEELAGL